MLDTTQATAHHAEMQRCILELDAVAVQKLWRHIAPHMSQPQSDEEALAGLHMARTGLAAAPFPARAYSHSWLMERGLPSQLPDRLKPRAERLYPWIVTAAAFSINFRSKFLRPIESLVTGAISKRMCELWAEHKKAPDAQLVLKEICDTKNATIKKLVGAIASKVDKDL
jgi:hypothetical protein